LSSLAFDWTPLVKISAKNIPLNDEYDFVKKRKIGNLCIKLVSALVVLLVVYFHCRLDNYNI
jgi:hypothetical protein